MPKIKHSRFKILIYKYRYLLTKPLIGDFVSLVVRTVLQHNHKK